MFGYKCQECGKGTVQPTTFTDYDTRFDGQVFVVPEAIIGVCDRCQARHYTASERKRWRRLFDEQNETRITTSVSLPVSLHKKLQTLKKQRKLPQSAIIADLIRHA